MKVKVLESRRLRLTIASLGVAFVAIVSATYHTRTSSAAARASRLEKIDDVAFALAEVAKANAAHDIELEEEILMRALSLEGDGDEHAEVQRRLAVLDWKYHARFEPARSRLRRATAAENEVAEAWLALARMEQSAGDFAAALTAARSALETATSLDETRRARLAFGRAAVERAVRERLEGRPGIGKALREAFGHLDLLMRGEPGQLDPSRRLLQAALLLDRGPGALAAWRSYFHVGPGGAAPNAIAEAGEQLAELLPGWAGGGNEPATRRIALVEALAGSRLFSEAVIVALDPRGHGSVAASRSVAGVVAYARLVRRLRELTDEYYRKTSIGEGDRDDYMSEVGHEAGTFLAALGDGTTSVERLSRVADERFGALVKFGRTAGYFNLHMGHRVVDEIRTITQYGRRAEVRFVMLDNLVSNGFQSWAWESGAQHGGWGGETIVQIRPAYAGSALRAWRELTDAEQVREVEEKIAEESARDWQRAASEPHDYFPGVTMRLRRQGQRLLLERLRSSGLAGEELRLAFYAAYEKAVQASSIFAHEGRHTIDRVATAWWVAPWKKEYNAKLSEVAFAPEPRLALGAIFSSNIGSGTPHGQANLEIMEGLDAWLREHADDIDGLDAARPLLPQFDRLTDEQIRAAFRSLDSLAR